MKLWRFIAVPLMLACLTPVHAYAQDHDHDHEPGDNHPPRMNFLTPEARSALAIVMAQDFQGRLKPLDTLGKESVMKVTKKHSFRGWESLDMYMSWMVHPEYWFEQPIIAVRHPDLKQLLAVDESVTHVTPASLMNASGEYRLLADVEAAHRTPDKNRTDMQRKLLSLDERVNVFYLAVRSLSLRMLPVPDDPNNRWFGPGNLEEEANQTLNAAVVGEYRSVLSDLYGGLQSLDSGPVLRAARALVLIQDKYGGAVLPPESARRAELRLNALRPLTWVTLPYLGAFIILMIAYAWYLARRKGARLSLRHPLYALGMTVYMGSVIFHIYGYTLRWVAAGHAPLSNGYESLIFVAVAIAVVGAYYEFRARNGSIGALAALLTSVILGVAMLPTFDPAISPLVPVLASYWLILHVTVITASYGFLGLGAVIAMTMLVLHLFKGPGRVALRHAIIELNVLHWNVLVAGLAFLTVGTFLGGVWANESWGRYWGWDPKESWSLITILVYAFVIHTRFIGRLNRPVAIATGSFLAITSIGMTYFGVNYFLSGLHAYARGSAPSVPGWVYVMAACMIVLAVGALLVDSARSWEGAGQRARAKPRVSSTPTGRNGPC